MNDGKMAPVSSLLFVSMEERMPFAYDQDHIERNLFVKIRAKNLEAYDSDHTHFQIAILHFIAKRRFRNQSKILWFERRDNK